MPTEHIGRPHAHQTCLHSILRKTLETGTAADVWDSGCPCALGQTQKSSQARIPTLGERLCPSGHRGVLSSMITEHPSITWPEQGLWYDSSVVWKNLCPSLILLANECTHGEWEQRPNSGVIRGLGPSGTEWQGRIAAGFACQHFCLRKLYPWSALMRRVVVPVLAWPRFVALRTGQWQVFKEVCRGSAHPVEDQPAGDQSWTSNLLFLK